MSYRPHACTPSSRYERPSPTLRSPRSRSLRSSSLISQCTPTKNTECWRSSVTRSMDQPPELDHVLDDHVVAGIGDCRGTAVERVEEARPDGPPRPLHGLHVAIYERQSVRIDELIGRPVEERRAQGRLYGTPKVVFPKVLGPFRSMTRDGLQAIRARLESRVEGVHHGKSFVTRGIAQTRVRAHECDGRGSSAPRHQTSG